MKFHRSGGLSLLLILGACQQAAPISHENMSMVNQYYLGHPIALNSGWLFRGAKDSNGGLQVDFVATKPLNKDPAQRRAILDNVCPGKTEPFWQMLPSRTKLMINVWSEAEKINATVVC